MDLRGAEIRNLYNLCGDMRANEPQPMRIVIPLYQRPYKWDKDHIEKLIDDYFKNGIREYFVGSVVMISPGPDVDELNRGRYSVIDGQQRTTTLFLMEYVRFLLLRSHLETVISQRRVFDVDPLLLKLAPLISVLFGDRFTARFEAACNEIRGLFDADDEKDDQFYENLLLKYQESVYLPTPKDYTDIDDYKRKYKNRLSEMLRICDLALRYNRDSYNERLKVAMSNVFIRLSDVEIPSLEVIDKELCRDESLEKQYTDSMIIAFNSILNHNQYDPKRERPMKYTAAIVDTVKEMMDNIKFCVILTGDEKDAYTLFEVLNDRAMAIDDLDLIKNIFYKSYCDKNSDDSEVDECIERVDKIWVEEIFNSDLGIDNAKLTSFLAAEFFTSADILKYADTAKYRDTIENNYLNRFVEYNSVNLTNDFLIYQMVAEIIKKYKRAVNKRNASVVSAEVEGYSITYRALHLLNALGQIGVIPAITNTIIRKYIDSHRRDDGSYNISGFASYLEAVKNDKNHENPDFADIHRVSYAFWRLALLCKDSDVPREEAKKVINRVNAFHNDYSYDIAATTLSDQLTKFDDFIVEWRYGKDDLILKAKVLFINLCYLSKLDGQLVAGPTGFTFNVTNLHLDHLDAMSPPDGNYESRFYFEPTGPGEVRLDYINSIGNMMILDGENNNDKDNAPLYPALSFYDSAYLIGHWLVTEIRDLIENDNRCYTIVGDIHVPTKEFFNLRRERLLSYFKALLRKGLNDSSVRI